MKVIVKSNEYIAIPTENKSKCLYELGQYLNKETCQIEMYDDSVRKITCTKRPHNSKYSKTIILEAEDLAHSKRYIILDKEGNLVNVVDNEQFNEQYAILQDDDIKN